MGRRPLPKWIAPFVQPPLTSWTSWGISSPFELLSPASGQVTNALLTRSPLSTISSPSFDLHVLGTPPAFILSQDQTLRKSLSNASASVTVSFSSLPGFLLITLQLLRCDCLAFQRLNADAISVTSARLTDKPHGGVSEVFNDLPFWRDLVCIKCVHYYTHE
jgi:hypothetical protein